MGKKIINKLLNKKIVEVIFGFLLKMQDNDKNNSNLEMMDVIRGKMIKVLKTLLFDFAESEFEEKRVTYRDGFPKIEKPEVVQKLEKMPMLLIKLLNKTLRDPGQATYQNIMMILEEGLIKLKNDKPISKNISREIYSTLLSLLIKKYNLFNSKIQEEFLKDILDILQRSQENFKFFRDTNNFITLLLSFPNNLIDQQIEEYQEKIIKTYVQFALINEDGFEILFYLLMYEKSKHFLKIMKIIGNILGKSQLPDNKAVYLNIYQICCLFDNYSSDEKSFILLNEYEFYSLINIFYVFLKEREALHSIYPQLKNIPLRIEVKDFMSKLAKANNLLQNGGFLLIMVKLMLRYVKRAVSFEERLDMINKIKNILSSETLLIKTNRSVNKIKSYLRSFDTFFDATSSDKFEDFKDVAIILELTLYKLIKILHEIQINAQLYDEISESLHENPLIPILVNFIAELIISYGFACYLPVLMHNPPDLVIENQNQNKARDVNLLGQSKNNIFDVKLPKPKPE